jgi:hypothetical protein
MPLTTVRNTAGNPISRISADKNLITDAYTGKDGRGKETQGIQERTADEIPVSPVLQNAQERGCGAELLRVRDPGLEHQLQKMGKAALVRPLILPHMFFISVSVTMYGNN